MASRTFPRSSRSLLFFRERMAHQPPQEGRVVPEPEASVWCSQGLGDHATPWRARGQRASNREKRFGGGGLRDARRAVVWRCFCRAGRPSPPSPGEGRQGRLPGGGRLLGGLVLGAGGGETS